MAETKRQTANSILNSLVDDVSDHSERRIRFIALSHYRQIDGMDSIAKILEEKQFSVEHFEFKIVRKSEVRRPINFREKDGPAEKVVVENRINVNTRLTSLEQLSRRVLKDPENVLLLQARQIKGEPLCAPLIFGTIFQNARQVLVTGATKKIRTQLLAKPDPACRAIPAPVQNHQSCLDGLIQRSRRAKGMQIAMRELKDFDMFPKAVAEKIKNIAMGRKTELSDAEAVNLLLLSDLHTRYASMFAHFQRDVAHYAGTDALARKFAYLMQNIKKDFLISKLRDYLGVEAARCQNNEQVFALLSRNLVHLNERGRGKDGASPNRTALFNLLRNIVLFSRSQHDPVYWGKCLFFLNVQDAETAVGENRATIDTLIDTCEKFLKKQQVISARKLYERYFLSNLHSRILERDIWIANQYLTKMEKGLIESYVMPNLHFRPTREDDRVEENGLFVCNRLPVGVLANPIHFVAATYGRTIHRRLHSNTQELLKPGVAELRKRYGTLFFDILYDRAVFEPGFPISRRSYFAFLQSHFSFKRAQEIGYVEPPSDSDVVFDPLLTQRIIDGSGESMFDDSFDNEDFFRKYCSSREQATRFFDSLSKCSEKDRTEYDPAPIFLDIMEKGNYNFRSSSFRKQVRETYLYRELQEVVAQACTKIETALQLAAINGKIAIQIPLRLDIVLFLGNIFTVSVEGESIQVRLLVGTSGEQKETDGFSRDFSRHFDSLLSSEATPARRGLYRAIRILQEHRTVLSTFLRHLSLLVLDRSIQSILQSEKQKNGFSPRHIKFYLVDSQKLIIGNVRNLNLSPVYRYTDGGGDAGVNAADIYTFGQFYQAMEKYEAAVEDIQAKREISAEVLKLLDRFPARLKMGKSWKRYQHLVERCNNMFSHSVENFDDYLLDILSNYSNALKNIVDAEEYKEGIVGLLHAEWQRRNSRRKKDIHFYAPFLNVKRGVGENNVARIRFARDLVLRLKQKRSLLFFPEESKRHQMEQMFRIGAFVLKRQKNLQIFVEIGALSDQGIAMLSDKFFPGNYFALNRLTPLAYDHKEAIKRDPRQSSVAVR